MPSITAREGSAGVEATFRMLISRDSSSKKTKSEKVPPVSTPTRIRLTANAPANELTQRVQAASAVQALSLASALGAERSRIEQLGHEELLDIQDAVGHALLVDVLGNRGDGVAGAGQAVGKRVVAEQPPGLLGVGDLERQAGGQVHALAELGVGVLLRRDEGVVQAPRQRAVALVHLAPHGDQVHDREVAGAAEVLDLDRREVREQAPHARRSSEEAGRRARRDERIDLAGVQQV